MIRRRVRVFYQLRPQIGVRRRFVAPPDNPVLFPREVNMKKWVYLYNEVDKAEAYAGNWDKVRALLGAREPASRT